MHGSRIVAQISRAFVRHTGTSLRLRQIDSYPVCLLLSSLLSSSRLVCCCLCVSKHFLYLFPSFGNFLWTSKIFTFVKSFGCQGPPLDPWTPAPIHNTTKRKQRLLITDRTPLLDTTTPQNVFLYTFYTFSYHLVTFCELRNNSRFSRFSGAKVPPLDNPKSFIQIQLKIQS